MTVVERENQKQDLPRQAPNCSPPVYFTLTLRIHSHSKKPCQEEKMPVPQGLVTSARSSLCGTFREGWNEHVETPSWLNSVIRSLKTRKIKPPQTKGALAGEDYVRHSAPVTVLTARLASFRGCPSSVELVFRGDCFTVGGPRNGHQRQPWSEFNPRI